MAHAPRHLWQRHKHPNICIAACLVVVLIGKMLQDRRDIGPAYLILARGPVDLAEILFEHGIEIAGPMLENAVRAAHTTPRLSGLTNMIATSIMLHWTRLRDVRQPVMRMNCVLR